MGLGDRLHCLGALCRERPSLVLDIVAANAIQVLNPGTARIFKNWRAYLSDHFGMARARPFVYALKNGVAYHARTRTIDREVIVEVWVDRYYTPPGFEIGPGDTVVDIGAHIGVFTTFAATQATRGMVYAFEPVPANFEMLRRNIELNCPRNVMAVNKGVSDREASRSICLRNTGMHSFYLNASGETAQVQTVSLASFMAERGIGSIDFLKIDCEGAEYEILFGCTPDVLARVRRISMEWHNLDRERNVLALKRFLARSGFEVTFTVGPGNFLVSGYLYAKRREGM